MPSTNKPGAPLPAEPGEIAPDGPLGPIKKRPATPEEKGTPFNRQPQGSLGAKEAFDVAQARESSFDSTTKRLFRQCASAGFRTYVRVSNADSLVAPSSASRANIPADPERQSGFARTD